MKKIRVLLCLCGALILPGASVAKLLELEDSKGRRITAEILSGTDEMVTIRKEGGTRSFELPLERFSAASRELIRKTLAEAPKPAGAGKKPARQAAAYPKLEFRVVVGKRRRQVKDSYYQKDQFISSTVHIRNTDRKKTLENAKGVLLIVAQDMKVRGRYQVISRQEFDIAVGAGASLKHVCETVKTRFDDDQNEGSNVGGLKYHGYALLVLDKGREDAVIQAAFAKGAMKKREDDHTFLAQVAGYAKGATVTRSLETPDPAGDGP